MWTIKGKHSQVQFDNRLGAISTFIIILFLVIFIRIFSMQVISGGYYRKISEANRIQMYVSRAPRGQVYDRKGKILIGNIPSYSVKFMKQGLTTEDLAASLTSLSRIMNTKLSRMEKLVREARDLEIVTIDDNVPRQVFLKVSEESIFIKGVRPEIATKRFYNFGAPSGHLYGYVSEIDPAELKYFTARGLRMYKMGDLAGKSGLEKVYDLELRGQDGAVAVETDAEGRHIRFLSEMSKEPVSGNGLELSIDYDLQEICDSLMSRRRGAIIVLDVRDFSVRALVSSPGFDSNRFFEKDRDIYISNLLKDPARPFFSRFHQSLYPPGSVFKIVPVAAAYEEKALSLDKTFFCDGKFILGRDRREFKCWKKEGHKAMNLASGFANSCDVFFYNLGLLCGPSRISEYAEKFRLNLPTGIDMSDEKRGLVPSPEWKKARRGAPWYEGDTLNISIGQGDILVTPLEAAVMISAVANGGNVYKPRILRSITDSKGRTVEVFKTAFITKLKVREDTLEYIRGLLEKVVNEGTGQACKIPGIRIGGKTGTSQNPHGADHAWFTAFAPADSPEISVTVFVEHGGHGGSAAAPLAKEIFLKYFGKKETGPDFRPAINETD